MGGRKMSNSRDEIIEVLVGLFLLVLLCRGVVKTEIGMAHHHHDWYCVIGGLGFAFLATVLIGWRE